MSRDGWTQLFLYPSMGQCGSTPWIGLDSHNFQMSMFSGLHSPMLSQRSQTEPECFHLAFSQEIVCTINSASSSSTLIKPPFALRLWFWTPLVCRRSYSQRMLLSKCWLHTGVLRLQEQRSTCYIWTTPILYASHHCITAATAKLRSRTTRFRAGMQQALQWMWPQEHLQEINTQPSQEWTMPSS